MFTSAHRCNSAFMSSVNMMQLHWMTIWPRGLSTLLHSSKILLTIFFRIGFCLFLPKLGSFSVKGSSVYLGCFLSGLGKLTCFLQYF